MKRTILGIIGLAGLMGMASCDKIESNADGTYAIYAGSTATWVEGTPIATPVQRAYVEKYTGPRCNNCPAADRTIEAAHEVLHEQLVAVSVNSMNEAFGAPGPNSRDMRTEDGAVWEQYWGVANYPAAYINRNGKLYDSDMATISADLQAAAAEAPIVALEGRVTKGDEISIDINLEFVQEYAEPLTLSLILIQDSLAYWQMDGSAPVPDYVHNHMLRDVITDVWGTDIDCTGRQGECRRATFKYSLPEEMENWHVVALVSDKESRRVLNSVQCE